jgi:hypothetical protein
LPFRPKREGVITSGERGRQQENPLRAPLGWRR